jgi:hypothetical protein
VIFTIPADTPVTTPVDNPTVATDILLLVQLPPGVGFVNVIVVPTQWLLGPELGITTGTGLTLIILLVAAMPHIFVLM